MRAIIPFLFGVGMGTDVLTDVPSHLNKWIGVAAEVFMFQARLVNQQEQIPVGFFVVVATGT